MNFTASFRDASRVVHRVGLDLGRKASAFLEQSEGWQVALMVALGLLAMAVVLPLALALAVLALLVAAVLGWVHEFVLLMKSSDDSFPGRFDKLVWAALLILLPPIGLLAFWSFRKAHWTEKRPTKRPMDDWF